MASVKTVIEIPEELYSSLLSHGFSKKSISKESCKLLVLKCYRDKILSFGKATELSGLSKWDFVDFLYENNISVIDHDEESLRKEMGSVKKIS